MFSVIVPVYNTAAYVREAIASVQAQSFKDWELILVDDGSTDDSPQICDSFAGEKIHVLHQTNQGVSAARNAGIACAKGEWLLFLDSDDAYDKNFMHVLAKSAGNADLLTANVHRIHQPDAILWQTLCELEITAQAFAYKMMHANTHNLVTSKAFSAHIVRKYDVRFPVDRTHGEDRAFVLSYLAHTKTICDCSEAIYLYRETPNSAVRSLKHDIAAMIERQYNSDLVQFAAFGFAKAEIEAQLRVGVADAYFREMCRLAQAKPARLAKQKMRRMRRSFAGRVFLQTPHAKLRQMFPGSFSKITLLLLRSGFVWAMRFWALLFF
jgi:glycosyltransferase involved in cell wall biosynthesis